MTVANRVSLFVPTLAGGGAEGAMLNIAEELANRRYEVYLVVTNATGERADQVPENVTLVDCGRSSLVASLPDLTSHLRAVDPDVLISSTNAANLVAIWAVLLSGTTATLLARVENMTSHQIENYEKRRYHAIPYLLQLFYGYPEAVVAVSRGVAQDIKQIAGVASDNVRVIYNPIVTEDLVKKSNQAADHPWLSDESVPVVLGVGRLTPQKDFSTLMRAFCRLLDRRDARLILAGKGERRAELQELAVELGIDDRVSLPGFVPNQYAYMANADVFVLSSAWEGFGNVLVEAMACGTPVASTDCESGPAEILAEGEYGPLVSVGDVDQLASAILDVLDDPIEEEALRERAQEFSARAIVTEYESLFESAQGVASNDRR